MRVQLVSIFDAFNYVKTAPCIGYPCIPPPKFSFHNKQCLLLVYIRVAACLPHSVMKSAGEPSILRARSCYATYRRNNGITAFGTGKAGEHRRSEQQDLGSAAIEFGELRGIEESRVVMGVTDFGKSVLAR
ncbi:hypothetical protein Y032_0020g129 [Ancylostoma ceylanicum]|uniref:Uncharacterized protein n=1 Tax=Ancylostoma ceylanicum TaxID=53326 RepID=A0A016V0D9_9BILA|nr:hypothetical protein Y032_0020g129 [Ancylostoma ceylanicum]